MHKIATLLTDNVLAAAAQQHAKPEHALVVLQDFRSRLAGKLFAGLDTDAFALANLISVLLGTYGGTKVALSLADVSKFERVPVVNAVRYLAGVSLKVAHDITLKLYDEAYVELDAEYDTESAQVLERYGVTVTPLGEHL